MCIFYKEEWLFVILSVTCFGVEYYLGCTVYFIEIVNFILYISQHLLTILTEKQYLCLSALNSVHVFGKGELHRQTSLLSMYFIIINMVLMYESWHTHECLQMTQCIYQYMDNISCKWWELYLCHNILFIFPLMVVNTVFSSNFNNC